MSEVKRPALHIDIEGAEVSTWLAELAEAWSGRYDADEITEKDYALAAELEQAWNAYPSLTADLAETRKEVDAGVEVPENIAVYSSTPKHNQFLTEATVISRQGSPVEGE